MAISDSHEDFPDALRTLMAATELSFRNLAEATGRYRYKPYTKGYLGNLAQGRAKPTIQNMEIIARAAGVSPTYFKSYREHLAAQEAIKVMQRVGLDKTLAKLRELDRA